MNSAATLARGVQMVVQTVALLLFASGFGTTGPARAQADESREIPLSEPRFDEQTARDMIAARSFYLVSRLTLNELGAWRGTAVKWSRTMSVEIDARGNFSFIDPTDWQQKARSSGLR